MQKIPRCMSTQHPDNVNPPFFSNAPELGGDDEIQEAYYVFSHLQCDEQMWDCEGKEVDNFVVKKLLSRYDEYFTNNVIGENVFITFRVPNPQLEKMEAKILLETLESIPRSFDTASVFYEKDVTPIFEVILPMTTSADELNNIYHYYKDFVAGKQNKLVGHSTIIKDWIGEFHPGKINVIPLVEDYEHIMNVDSIVRTYLSDKDISDQRVFLARSDPAMNYGFFSAITLTKIALQRLKSLSKETGVRIHPIIGVGTAPFRGNLSPYTVEKFVDEYPSLRTFTLQSAFKYDYPPKDVVDAVQVLHDTPVRNPRYVDEEAAIGFMEKYSEQYRKEVMELAPLINKVAKFIPARRMRKLHISLFGYSRSMGGITLPRAIAFTASLYSMGFPPELIALTSLDENDIDIIRRIHYNFDDTLSIALSYYNPSSYKLTGIDLSKKIEMLDVPYESNEDHKRYTESIIECLRKAQTEPMERLCLQAAHVRKFLG
ncbi:MAG: phosphoenolpyruvate carboxylase [Candidatus Methanofastidiosa archaeon]|nr:phosphoenolpyruvate carboxylase [Candidatus Methanofastidiosa archaeon]